ncbi:hypothetical protein B9Z55_012837 [Caenorhabditis nigoni]|uniref:Uncharacterized protein n=1 Tax=Caenorhabditis nigoni TaxID=1611254 RepID=A0A2G5TZ04_9PELO|nr:hypothetical protein B9Z55_012837 [Caenorhabditis nigoni]
MKNGVFNSEFTVTTKTVYAMLPSRENDYRLKIGKQALRYCASRETRNVRFLEELANFRYGNTKEGKERYDKIGEKFAFWKRLTNEQKRCCAVADPTAIRDNKWIIKNGITISDEEKEDFLEQRLVLDKITFQEKFECLFNAKRIETSRVQLIENPLKEAFSKFPLNFEEFNSATQDVPESDFYIRAWFEKKAHERTSESNETDEIQIIETVSRTPPANGFSTEMRDDIPSAPQPQYDLSAQRRDIQSSSSAWNPNLEVLESYSPSNFGDNRPASSSQASSCSLPNVISTDRVTHRTRLSIAPPSRMVESIMKKVSNEMKQREESGSLDFGPIRVKLTATGKELDDSISFLKNLKSQLEAAKQVGSDQQL